MTDELALLAEAASAGVALGNRDLEHLSSRLALLNYARLADSVPEAGRRLLDWGCGYGQMIYLLRNRGVHAEGYNVAERPNRAGLPIFGELPIMYGDDPVRLPFPDGAFDAALSCGTLEHVPDARGSLGELRRVLKPGGRLYVFFLPNLFSWVETLATLRGVSDHPVKYTARGIARLLQDEGFSVAWQRRGNVLPKNFTGLPRLAKRAVGALGVPLLAADRALSALPWVRVVAGTHELLAVREER